MELVAVNLPFLVKVSVFEYVPVTVLSLLVFTASVSLTVEYLLPFSSTRLKSPASFTFRSVTVAKPVTSPRLSTLVALRVPAVFSVWLKVTFLVTVFLPSSNVVVSLLESLLVKLLMFPAVALFNVTLANAFISFAFYF